MIIESIFSIALLIPAHQPEQVQTINRQAARAASHIPAEWEPFRQCVAKRESGHRYNARNPISSAQGKYQFLDNSWRNGGGWNVYKALRLHGYHKTTAKRLLHRLHSTPIYRWKPIYQEILFAYVLTSREGMGWKHWYLAGSRCNRLAR